MTAEERMNQAWSRAYLFASEKHSGQVRKYTGEPYVNHCMAVADLVRERSSDPEIVAAALLHDTLEDTDTTLFEIQREFGDRVARLVREVTDVYTKKEYPNWNRRTRKEHEAQRLGHISEDAKLIKLCDLIDNTESIVRHDPRFAIVYLREKADILESMGYGSGLGNGQ